MTLTTKETRNHDISTLASEVEEGTVLPRADVTDRCAKKVKFWGSQLTARHFPICLKTPVLSEEIVLPPVGSSKNTAQESLTFFAQRSVVLLLVVETAARYYFYQRNADSPLGILAIYDKLRPLGPHVRYEYYKPLIQPDPVVGFKNVPGEHVVRIKHRSKTWEFRATINQDGYRRTSGRVAETTDPIQIWLFGCSYVWGFPLNDEVTIPWLLQVDLPHARVRSLAGNSYGNVQALLQLQDAERRAERLPDIAVFFYNSFHKSRNIADPAWLRTVWDNQKYVQAVDRYQIGKCARACLDEGGNFTILLVPRTPTPIGGTSEPGEYFRVKMTNAILFRLASFCKAHGITAIFAIQSKEQHDEVISYASHLTGFHVADISIDLDENHGYKYRCKPFDPHPNRLAHREYEKRLLPFVKQSIAEQMVHRVQLRGRSRGQPFNPHFNPLLPAASSSCSGSDAGKFFESGSSLLSLLIAPGRLHAIGPLQRDVHRSPSMSYPDFPD